MMERGIIDRFEGDIAVIEIEGRTRDIRRSLLPLDAKVGDSILIRDTGDILVDPAATADRKKQIQELMDDLFE
jgi:hypothetical protein